MVKDVDGVERYESAAEMKFSDGSMEQDLPMQQLSEMFNVNHFIISQANPHAVMFGTYQVQRSIWSHPITGLFNSLLVFLKDQLRGWLTHAVELVGGRRFSPLFGTQRELGLTILTQEYEGRECDISMVPWLSHRSLFSAFLHCIYNPNKLEFLDWIDAAERETWKHIPAIKSHIAEEITLDRCVQRLRQRLTRETLEKKRTNSYNTKMGERVPSFFTSPSLVNLGGLGVGDQTVLNSLDSQNDSEAIMANSEQPIPNADAHGGWGGLGVHGNRPSASNLTRSASSGFFIDDEEQRLQQTATDQQATQTTGEHTGHFEGSLPIGYVKTTSMANFYYRRDKGSRSHPSIHKSVSDHQVKDGAASPHLSESSDVERRKSKSQSDLYSASRMAKKIEDHPGNH